MDPDQLEAFLRRTTLRQVEIIVAIQDHSSMTKAAKFLGMSVANVSRATKRFEKNTGLRIFNASNRRRLSPQCQEIIGCFRPLQVDILQLRKSLQALVAIQPDDPRGPQSDTE